MLDSQEVRLQAEAVTPSECACGFMQVQAVLCFHGIMHMYQNSKAFGCVCECREMKGCWFWPTERSSVTKNQAALCGTKEAMCVTSSMSDPQEPPQELVGSSVPALSLWGPNLSPKNKWSV